MVGGGYCSRTVALWLELTNFTGLGRTSKARVGLLRANSARWWRGRRMLSTKLVFRERFKLRLKTLYGVRRNIPYPRGVVSFSKQTAVDGVSVDR
jgi:hypothetical protein